MKINFFKKENNFEKKDFTFNSNLYWGIIVGGTFIAILFSFFSGYRLFTQINQESILPVANESGQVPIINTERIKKALNFFSEREKKSIEIINSSSPVVDPSL